MRKKIKLFDFKSQAKLANQFLKDDGFELSFKGYDDTVSHFFRLDDADILDAFELMTECNMWSNYISEVEKIVELKLNDAKTEFDRLNAEDTPKIEAFFNTKKRISTFRIFSKQLVAQRKFFEGAYWHCFEIFNKGQRTLKYRAE